VAGDVWSVHGGAFYRVVKYAGAPPALPHELHWFRWEAYLTWLSGFFLLVLVYWSDAASTIAAPGSSLGTFGAIALSASVLVGGWLAYDTLCRTLGGRPRELALLIALVVAAVDFGLSKVMAPRAAYLHVGAMLGTWMAANVLFVIIPGQRAMVGAMITGAPPPVERGKAGALRSLHNNYLTLPVLFVMVSGHFPSTWGHPYGWLVLLGIAGGGVAVRHALNVAERGSPMPWLWPLAGASLLAAALLARPVAPPVVAGAAPIPMATVQGVVSQRCLPCHAAQPVLGGYAAPPVGLVLDRPEAIEANRAKIGVQVRAGAMPKGNLTGMTDEERALIVEWASR
jgi:uncharacterized membrane protein